MVLPFSKIALGTFGLLGTGGLGLAGTYQFTKQTIRDGLNSTELVDVKDNPGSSTAWTKLLTKLNNSSEPNPKSEKFKNIKTTLSETETTPLKELCKSVVEDIYSSIFFTNEDLLTDVKNFCSISLKDMLEISKVFSSGDKPDSSETSVLSTKLTELASHNEGESGKLDVILEDLKNNSPSVEADKRQKDLFNWCKSKYDSYYVNESQNLKKLVFKYCQKS